MAVLSKATEPVDSARKQPAPPDKERYWDLLPRSPAAILAHALKGALRAFTVAYGARAVFTLILRLLAVLRGKSSFGDALVVALRGTPTLRFGAAFGVFAFVWKLVNHALREIRGIDDRWNNFIGGFLGGFALLIESPQYRVTYAQQFFVRALQASYASLHARNLISIPYGGALLFMAAGSQTMYAYMMKPNTLPPDFYKFMVKAARVPDAVLRYNAHNVIHGCVDPAKGLELVKRYKGTARNMACVASMSSTPGIVPCALVHPRFDSCIAACAELWLRVFQMIAPVYTSLNFAPMLTLHLFKFIREPLPLLRKAFLNTLRSSSFLATYVGSFLVLICAERNVSQWIGRIIGRRLGDSKLLIYLFCWLNGLAIFIEHPTRRVELGLYVLPKAAESLFAVMVQRRLAVVVPYGEVGLFAIGMGIIMSFYQAEPEYLTPMMRRLMRPFFGRF
ncbi:hypothetical protein SYNPS1DRAFT_21802 [Syncephalis pseudoplumigaleata]|uniref:Transmembrane protein 135 N-terminal domain-containing protein n=1 Tax=Syncephalis pseudoplumigaleata TaxID=1712513 RepID=A0A4P9Z1R9_9FUNG|nr:hypothetical protein SYNPS1DRAFT_21802 [Syncephalis pseudoplumigaleata]|eukprot:RKP26437.1 hypothetical protein SYNPS1DRAFT_21802 [Syncephalis pseudoplumigaleata]